MTTSEMQLRAESLLIQAKNVHEIEGKLDNSLQLYQESLSIWLNLYKMEPESTLRKGELLKILEHNMAEAEKVKKLISIKKLSMANSSDSNSNFSLSSLTSFLPFGNKTSVTSNGNPPNKVANDSSPQTVFDFFDYNAEMRNAVSESARNTDKTNSASNNTTTRTIKVPIKGGKKTTETLASRKIKATNEKEAANVKMKAVANATAESPNEYETQILSEMLEASPGVTWNDIAGLVFAKQTLQEAVILPNLRPDLFTGLRSPPRGVLLFGPPGTGKTLLAKAVATESGFCFFSISASSVTSKYLGEGEKLIKALFSIARTKQPAVVFFDEIDALMSARKENEHEASRRLKTEFMTQMDGATTSSADRILIMSATNIPWEIDEAVLRRLEKRIYIPLPEAPSRLVLIEHLLRKQGSYHIDEKQMQRVVAATAGYSGSDLAAVCKEAAMGPIRDLGAALRTVKAEDVRPLNAQDFVNALTTIKPSVSASSLTNFTRWGAQFGATLR